MVQFPSAPFPPRCFHVKLSHRIVHVGHSKLYRPITSRYSGDYVHSFRKLSCLLITPIPAPKRWIQKKDGSSNKPHEPNAVHFLGLGNSELLGGITLLKAENTELKGKKAATLEECTWGGGNPPYRGDNSSTTKGRALWEWLPKVRIKNSESGMVEGDKK